MRITCEIIKDLLPLYHDNVCCEDSRKLVEEHLSTCSSCKKELELIRSEIKVEHNIEDINMMKKISKKWKQDRLSAFLIGIILLSLLACIGCGFAYQSIGSYVAADGMLVEPFALIPLSFLSGFIAFVSSVILGITTLLKHKK